jgi:hypothetical protein
MCLPVPSFLARSLMAHFPTFAACWRPKWQKLLKITVGGTVSGNLYFNDGAAREKNIIHTPISINSRSKIAEICG